MTRKIEVVPYDPTWPDLFETEAAKLAAVFGPEVVTIHHIGSTSIWGIQAKPIIDILLEVKDIARVDAFNEAMTRLGYTPKGEFGIVGRRYFCKAVNTIHTHHVHTFQTGHPDVARHVYFRDYLRAHPAEAQAYSQLKESLTQQFPDDPEGYTNAKSEFIGDIDKKAKTWKGNSNEP